MIPKVKDQLAKLIKVSYEHGAVYAPQTGKIRAIFYFCGMKDHIQPLKAIVFDWGDTIMRDFGLPGPMSAWEKVAWIPGAETALQWLSQKYCCIIATSAPHSDTAEMKAALARVGADVYFSRFYSQKELGYKKPDIRFFEKVLELSDYKPHETLMVGNLYEKDIQGAKKAGMHTVYFNENHLQGHFPDADFQINDMAELPKVLLRF